MKAKKKKSEADLLDEYKEIALRRVKLGLLLSQIGQEAEISIKPEDINAAIMNEAKKYPGQEKVVLDYYLKNKSAVDALKAPIFEEKIIDYIIGKAKVNDKIVSVEELYNFDEENKTKKASKNLRPKPRNRPRPKAKHLKLPRKQRKSQLSLSFSEKNKPLARGVFC